MILEYHWSHSKIKKRKLLCENGSRKVTAFISACSGPLLFTTDMRWIDITSWACIYGIGLIAGAVQKYPHVFNCEGKRDLYLLHMYYTLPHRWFWCLCWRDGTGFEDISGLPYPEINKWIYIFTPHYFFFFSHCIPKVFLRLKERGSASE